VRRSTRLPIEALAPYLLELPARPAREVTPLDWKAIFDNGQPVEIEVGCGKGLFLLTTALARPEVNFLGVEIVRKYQLFTATRIAKRSLKNVRLSCADARTLLSENVPAASVQAVHVYFPDPWWKRKHHKRRVFTAEFVASVARVLRPGGHLHVATDVEEYFGVMRELIAASTDLQIVDSLDSKSEFDCLTNFERKARLIGKPIYRASAIRTG
jgi:tRNA (guanine-N7-)-methyltransferase